MDIKERLMEEHSRSLTSEIIKFVGADRKKFQKLFILFLEGDRTLAQRASWALSEVSLKEPQLVKTYIARLIKKLKVPGQHPAIYRHILRIFQSIEIEEKYMAELFDVCIKFLISSTSAVAIKALAITVAANLCRAYPELGKELYLILEGLSILPQPPAIRHRIKMAIKELPGGDLIH